MHVRLQLLNAIRDRLIAAELPGVGDRVYVHRSDAVVADAGAFVTVKLSKGKFAREGEASGRPYQQRRMIPVSVNLHDLADDEVELRLYALLASAEAALTADPGLIGIDLIDIEPTGDTDPVLIVVEAAEFGVASLELLATLATHEGDAETLTYGAF